MNRKRFIILLTMTLALLSAWSQTTFKVIQPRTAIEGQNFKLTFRVTNGQLGSNIQAPNLNNCKLIYGPSTSTMQSTQIINGQMSSSVTIDYSFTYHADKAGEVSVPAVEVSIDGKRYTSDAVKFTILPPDRSSQGNNGGASPANPSVTESGDLDIAPDDMFVRIILNRNKVYEQEPVVVTVKLYTRYDISSFKVNTLPTFEGFLSEELDVPNNNEIEHYNGKNYTTAVLKRCIVYPQRPGNLKITSGKFDVTLVGQKMVSNGYWRTPRRVEKQVATQTNSATVEVLALPQPQPEGFTGAVGSYTATVEMNPTELRTNEAASYIVKIQGSGNIKYLKTPSIELPAGIDQYTPKTDINARFTGSNMEGSYSVNYTLVPQEPGNFEIPSWQFSYFNPTDKEYHTIEMPKFDIRVAQGASTSTAVEQKAIAKGMSDILHIKPISGDLSQQPHYAFRTWLYWVLYIAAALSLLIFTLAYRRRLRLNADVQGRRLARANKQANKRFREAKAAMSAHNPDQFYQALHQAMSGYLSDKLGIPASQLVRENIAKELAQRGLSQEGIDNAIQVLDECEMARFTPQHSDSEMSQLLNQATSAIKSIENQK